MCHWTSTAGVSGTAGAGVGGGQAGAAGAGVAGAPASGGAIGSGGAVSSGGAVASGGIAAGGGGAGGSKGGAGGAVSSGGVVASGGATGAGGRGGSAGGGAGGQAGAQATVIGWLPCAAQGETCTLPAGATRVLYGDAPDGRPGAHSKIQTFASGATLTCSNSTFSGSPNTSCSSCPMWCWYEGQVTPIFPSTPLTGPAITLPLVTVAWPGFTLPRLAASSDLGTLHNDVGAFRDTCGFAKFDFNDPIVFPGVAEAAHLHMFLGNTGVSELSTPLSIQTTGGSTCAGGILNRSAYWVPAMVDRFTGLPVYPSFANIYYKTGGLTPANVHAVPPGLVMVTGNSHSFVRGANPVRYGCVSDSTSTPWQPNIPTCPDSTWELVAEFTFPQCWDGVHLDSSDHISHMGNPVGSSCPAAFPVGLPVITYQIRWRMPRANASADFQLSSDAYAMDGTNAGYSGHADYMYGWDTPTMQKFVTNCLVPSTDCHDYLLGNGQTLY
jgi:hypothetical protein